MAQLIIFLCILAPVGFILFWCAIVYLLSFQSGWKRLAQTFQAQMRPPGQTFWMQPILLNSVRYQGAVTIRVTENGLYLAVLPIFRIGHAPMFIPWVAFSDFTTQKILWITQYQTTISISPDDRVTLILINAKSVAAIEEQRAKSAISQPFSSI